MKTQLVPVEMTQEMKDKAQSKIELALTVGMPEYDLTDGVEMAWRAALEAAPTPPAQEEPVAYRWVESKLDCWRYDETPNPHRQCEPLYTRPDNSELRKAAVELLDAMSVEYNKIEEVINLRSALEGK